MLNMDKLFDDVFNSPLDDSPVEAESHSATASQTPSLVDKQLAFSKTHDATSRAGHSVERVAVLLGGGSPSADVAEEMRRSSPNGVEYTEEFVEMLVRFTRIADPRRCRQLQRPNHCFASRRNARMLDKNQEPRNGRTTLKPRVYSSSRRAARDDRPKGPGCDDMVGLDEHTCQRTRVTGSELRERSGEHCRVADTNGVGAVNLALI